MSFPRRNVYLPAMTPSALRLAGLLVKAREEVAKEAPPRCTICGKEKWQHSGVEMFCPIYATYRAPELLNDD